jgi:hypothetical protein
MTKASCRSAAATYPPLDVHKFSVNAPAANAAAIGRVLRLVPRSTAKSYLQSEPGAARSTDRQARRSRDLNGEIC